jgi:hypothetical protein
MNDATANTLNKELGNSVDSPETVAMAIIDTITAGSKRNRYIGWPEKLYVRINAIFPSIVDSSIKKQLSVIKQHIEVN